LDHTITVHRPLITFTLTSVSDPAEVKQLHLGPRIL
jgi:hypothetical protein